MSVVPLEPSGLGEAKKGWSWQLPEMWASLAIIAMWLAVLFDAVWGPDFVSSQRRKHHDDPVVDRRGCVCIPRHEGRRPVRLRS